FYSFILLFFYSFILLFFYSFILLFFYCFILLFFYSLRKRKGEGYKPYKKGQKIKITNRINIDQN
ncbi:hypothetical protein, partial [Helicobacter pylori]|uniref:hypothetical protein n=1 Tax=Helicobacter pylori TaxID=210 RepID=UPI000ACA341E